MKSGLVMKVNIEGMEELKSCADNVLKSVQQLEEAVQEFNECTLTLDCCQDDEKSATDKIEIKRIFSPCEEIVELYEHYESTLGGKPTVLKNVGGCESPCNTPFGREDLDDIISDLQEEYYRLGKGNVGIKIQIADSIDRLCRLRETLEVI